MTGRREEMLVLREKLLAERPGMTLAAELAPLMGELEPEYWSWCIERYIAQQDGGQQQ